MCPQLDSLSVGVWEELEQMDEDHIRRSQLSYPKMKRLNFFAEDDMFRIGPFNRFLHKLIHLERLELLAYDNFWTVRSQLDELRAFIDFIHNLASASYVTKPAAFHDHTILLPYLQLFFQPHVLWKHTTLKIHAVSFGDSVSRNIHYIINGKHRELAIVIPKLERNEPSTSTAYAEIFAPYVNKLEVNYRNNASFIENEACKTFLNTIFTHCNILD